FLAYERLGALLRSSVLYGLILVVSLPHAFATWNSEAPFGSFNALGQLYISSAAMIAVLFSFTGMRDRLREAQVAADDLAALAQTDALTEVSNRRHIEALLESEMERSSRYGSPLSFITFDLDNFKQINDAFGHDVGDAVLVEVARLIEPHLRSGDHLGRWGGEEFVILATGAPVESAWHLAERVRTTIEGHAFGPEARLSASFGVAMYRQGESASMLVKRSDVALYRAKTRGKNRVEVEWISA
ncbi:MAG: GGDEF domain-containing protein, partial [Rubrobacter sp.]